LKIHPSHVERDALDRSHYGLYLNQLDIDGDTARSTKIWVRRFVPIFGSSPREWVEGDRHFVRTT
jgi:hypothetical protein